MTLLGAADAAATCVADQRADAEGDRSDSGEVFEDHARIVSGLTTTKALGPLTIRPSPLTVFIVMVPAG